MTTHAPISSLYPREGIAPTMLGLLLGLGILTFFVCVGLVVGLASTFESSYSAPHQ